MVAILPSRKIVRRRSMSNVQRELLLVIIGACGLVAAASSLALAYDDEDAWSVGCSYPGAEATFHVGPGEYRVNWFIWTGAPPQDTVSYTDTCSDPGGCVKN